jgi:hypothetical protein
MATILLNNLVCMCVCQKVLKRTGATREKNNLKEKLKRYTTSIHVALVTRNTFWPKKSQ